MNPEGDRWGHFHAACERICEHWPLLTIVERPRKYVLVIRIGQTEGTIMGFPIFDQSVVESGCHLANEVPAPRSGGREWFSSIDQLLRLVVFEFGQDLG